MCRCFFVPLLLQQENLFLCSFAVFQCFLQPTKNSLWNINCIYLFIFPFGLYLQSLDGKWQFLSEGSFETGWSLLPSTLASPKIRQRRPEAVLRSSELSSTGDGPVLVPCSPMWSLVVILSASLTFKTFCSWLLWLAGILLHMGIPAVSGICILF